MRWSGPDATSPVSSVKRSGSAPRPSGSATECSSRRTSGWQKRATGPGAAVRLQVRNGTFGTVVGGVDPVGNAPTREGDVPRVEGDVAGPVESEGPGRGDLGAGGRARRRSSGRSPWQLCRDLDQPRLCPHRVPLPGDHCRPHLRPRGRQPLPGGRLHPAVSRTAVQQPLRRSP